jgi:predicted ribosomally synthesized peptide with nif11-like leader
MASVRTGLWSLLGKTDLQGSGAMVEERLEGFLARVRADPVLQRALQDHGVAEAAVAVARAAGFVVSAAELQGSGGHPQDGRDRYGGDGRTVGGDVEEVDFDGDGLPDAVREGSRWVIPRQEDW